MQPKLGKLEARPKPQDFKLSSYIIDLPKPMNVFGFGKLYPAWGMLGNDQYGDCVWASAAHQTMIWNKLRKGHDVPFTPKVVLSDYAAVTGFDPVTGSGDNGTYVDEAMSYRRKTGVLDGIGQRHKIAAYVSIDPKNWDAMIQACFIFGVVEIGFEFPETAWAQFDNGLPWEVDDMSSPIDGGHDVPIAGTVSKDDEATCITWGRRQIIGRDFYETYNDEAWVPLSAEQIRADGTGIHGLDLDKLNADLAAL